MRQGRSYSIKQETKEMEIDKLSSISNSGKLKKEEAHLSGAYIRSLVKQLTSSKTKDTSNMTNPKDPQKCLLVGSDSSLGLGSETQPQTQPTQPQQQQHKKQVRRRLHTSRPYQERLLNMAEARREIVTALKFHRASMKQASEQQQQQQNQDQPPQPQQPQPNLPLHFEQQESVKIKCRRNHRIYPSSSSSSSSSSCFTPNFSPYQAQNPYLWPRGQAIPTLPFGGAVDHQTLANNFPLPDQALGLNLNFQDFTDIDLTTINTNTTTTSLYSAPAGPSGAAGLHAAMDEEEIAEIKSLGEQHQIEWSDTMNLVTSAYWSKFLRPPPPQDHHHHDGLAYHDRYPFDDQVLEFPSWLSANDCRHYFDDCYSSDDYFNSPSLTCMDIGEIDGMDEDWLA